MLKAAHLRLPAQIAGWVGRGVWQANTGIQVFFSLSSMYWGSGLTSRAAERHVYERPRTFWVRGLQKLQSLPATPILELN